jgi:hypothetical protein
MPSEQFTSLVGIEASEVTMAQKIVPWGRSFFIAFCSGPGSFPGDIGPALCFWADAFAWSLFIVSL